MIVFSSPTKPRREKNSYIWTHNVSFKFAYSKIVSLKFADWKIVSLKFADWRWYVLGAEYTSLLILLLLPIPVMFKYVYLNSVVD